MGVKTWKESKAAVFAAKGQIRAGKRCLQEGAGQKEGGEDWKQRINGWAKKA